MADVTSFLVLNDDPPVVVISSGVMFDAGVRLAIRWARGRHCQVVVKPAWHLPSQLHEFLPVVRAVGRTHRRICFTFLCPSMQDTHALQAHGLQALHVHTNAFVDHRIFRPMALPRRLSAVHVASVEPFKRHPLAWGVENIGVVTYDWRGVDPHEQLHGYRRVGFANFAFRDGRCVLGRRLTPSQVARVINSAHCGLILSAEEGQNNASTEYLLCGVPVISTPSIGGREEMFDPAHSMTVSPDPATIETAVMHYRGQTIDPQAIRESVMRKIRDHRRRFIGWLSAVTGCDQYAAVDADAWHPRFVPQLKRIVRF